MFLLTFIKLLYVVTTIVVIRSFNIYNYQAG